MSQEIDGAEGRRAAAEERDVRTPQGTMLIVLVYIGIMVVLWGYVYYDMLRFAGVAGGH